MGSADTVQENSNYLLIKGRTKVVEGSDRETKGENKIRETKGDEVEAVGLAS